MEGNWEDGSGQGEKERWVRGGGGQFLAPRKHAGQVQGERTAQIDDTSKQQHKINHPHPILPFQTQIREEGGMDLFDLWHVSSLFGEINHLFMFALTA